MKNVKTSTLLGISNQNCLYNFLVKSNSEQIDANSPKYIMHHIKSHSIIHKMEFIEW